MFNLVGPWFDDTFDKKNYPYDDDPVKLQIRHGILGVFMDAFSKMLGALEVKYTGVVNYVDLRGTLQSRDEWAN